MDNQSVYFEILKKLKFNNDDTVTAENLFAETDRVKHNLDILRNYIKEDVQELLTLIAKDVKLDTATFNDIQIEFEADENSCYIILLQRLLLCIINENNLYQNETEKLVSLETQTLCLRSAKDLMHYAMCNQLHELLHKNQFCKTTQIGSKINYNRQQLSLAFFEELMRVPLFRFPSLREPLVKYQLATIISIHIANALQQYTLNLTQTEKLQQHMDFIWSKISKVEFFRNMLLLLNIKELPAVVKSLVYRNLNFKLASAGGFAALVNNLKTNTPEQQQIFELVSNLACNPKHSQHYQTNMISKIFDFVHQCLLDEDMLDSIGAGLLSLRRLYDLSAQNQKQIELILREYIECLSQPPDLITGLILMEHSQFCLIIHKFYNIFCISSIECLPSKLLIPYLPLLLQLYFNIPQHFEVGKQIGSLIERCLHNRSDKELQEILQQIYTHSYPAHWLELHARTFIKPSANITQLDIKIAASDFENLFCLPVAFSDSLKNSKNNILIYKIFMTLLKIMWPILQQQHSTVKKQYLFSMDETVDYINKTNDAKFDLLLTLNSLTLYEPLSEQISANASEFLDFFSTVLQERIKLNTNGDDTAEETDRVLYVLLSISQELVQATQQPQKLRNMLQDLKQLQHQTANELVKQRLTAIITLLTNDSHTQKSKYSDTKFQKARNLVESTEPYMQVEGIQMLIDLLHCNDSGTKANAGILVPLALTTLKNKESYTFLNCVRLFVCLVRLLDEDVVELLCHEYVQEGFDVDYRLVVGETIIKVCAELGPLCFKHKGELLNTFMSGARSPLNEFRMSAFANLAQLCRILTYQVHKFFYELLQLIECELSNGKYVPAKRAAVLVLSELLTGMDNLFDFEEMLLPIYRVLRTIAANETTDRQTRIHASNGLKTLNEKCMKLLFKEQELTKEIQILNIKDNSHNNDKRKKSILQIL